MKKYIFVFPSLIFLSFIFLSCKDKTDLIEPRETAKIQEKLQSIVDQAVNEIRAANPGFPGGIALKVISRQNSYFVSSGMGESVTDDYHFRAASNTKTFTSTAILLLAQEGKLNIDAKITDFIPGTSIPYVPQDANYNIPYKNQITIRLLLQHNAGVFDVSNEYIPDTVSVQVPYKGKWYLGYMMDQNPAYTFTFDELVGVVAKCRLSYFLPGTNHKYSNTGYSILGKIIERVSGQTYPQFVTERIIKPMGLTSTTMPSSGSDRQLPAPFVKGYIYDPQITDCTVSNISANVAEGNIVTTPKDLAKFLRTLLRGEGVLSPVWVNSLMLNIPKVSFETMNYALGIFYTPNLGWGHNGAHEGYYSNMVSDPNSDFTVVAFTNSWIELPGGTTLLLSKLVESSYKAKYIVQ